MSRSKVHNGDLYLDLLQNADWSSSANIVNPSAAKLRLEAVERQIQELSCDGAKSLSPKRCASPNKKKKEKFIPVSDRLETAERKLRQTEIFLEKQRAREMEMKRNLDAYLKDIHRRNAERIAHRDKDFEGRYGRFMATNQQVIRDVTAIVQENEQVAARRKERLYQDWMEQVFLPTQREIDDKLDSMTASDITAKRRQMFQSFLDESNKKPTGLYRDIIMECDYDPLATCKEATMRYGRVAVTADPTQSYNAREKAMLATIPGFPEKHFTATSTMKPCEERDKHLPVQKWTKPLLHDTPYGRYGELPTVTKPKYNSSKVHMDHFNVLKGHDAHAEIHVETNVRGKRVFPQNPSAVFPPPN